MSVDKQEIQIIESEQSNVTILHVDSFISIALAFAVGMISFISIIIKGLFIYYIKRKAPKDRPINRMIFFDQVMSHYQIMTVIRYVVLKVKLIKKSYIFSLANLYLYVFFLS